MGYPVNLLGWCSIKRCDIVFIYSEFHNGRQFPQTVATICPSNENNNSGQFSGFWVSVELFTDNCARALILLSSSSAQIHVYNLIFFSILVLLSSTWTLLKVSGKVMGHIRRNFKSWWNLTSRYSRIWRFRSCGSIQYLHGIITYNYTDTIHIWYLRIKLTGEDLGM